MKLCAIVAIVVCVAGALASEPARAAGPCDGTGMTVDAPETLAWVGRLFQALAQEQACSAASADQNTFIATSACNIFVGRVLERAYHVTDFIVTPPVPNRVHYTANEIATLLQAGVWRGWTLLGQGDSADALAAAKRSAEEGKLVLAVWRNPNASAAGHVALVGPGPLTPSGRWGVSTPVSASFTIGQPLRAFLGKPLSCAFRADIKQEIQLWVRG